jgi:hypothetical protein
MSAVHTFHIEASPAQYALFREALLESERLGDCNVSHRFAKVRITFEDYEGVMHTLKRLIAVRTMTAADIRSWEAIKRKIDTGVRDNLKIAWHVNLYGEDDGIVVYLTADYDVCKAGDPDARIRVVGHRLYTCSAEEAAGKIREAYVDRLGKQPKRGKP